MKIKTNLLFFAILLLSFGGSAVAQESFSSFERARLHPLTYNKPAVDFFEGALLGNGAMGVVVTTRPMRWCSISVTTMSGTSGLQKITGRKSELLKRFLNV